MHVVATAGHVDHGKSTLVRLLTGMEPDRWAEEHRRGMTIDLGFAWTRLPSGRELAIVDVPGHERFIGNMLAGVGPAPAVLFVVAADEGWMPQSVEHLDAVAALGTGHALLVVTRSDLADPRPAAEQACEQFARAGIVPSDVLTLSGRTGAGTDSLPPALDRLLDRLPDPDPDVPFRMWVDRSFTVRGAGTVVTGTLRSGSVRPGDALRLQPADRTVTVRSVQSLGRPVPRAEAVARVALNLRGVPHTAVHRGDVLADATGWRLADRIDVRLVPGVEEGTGRLPRELVLHVGTAALTVTPRLLGGDTARLRLPAGLPLRVGDRALLRDPGRRQVLAGVVVLDVCPPPLRRRGAAAARAGDLAGVTGTAADGAAYVRREGLVRAADLTAMGLHVPFAPAVGDWVIDPDHWKRSVRRLGEIVRGEAAADPLQPGLPLDVARRRLGLADLDLVRALAAAPEAGLTVQDGRIRTSGATAGLDPGLEQKLQQVHAELRADPFVAPEAYRLADLGLGTRELSAAVRAGRLLRVADGIYLAPGADRQAAALLAEGVQPFTVSQARQMLGTTRRVAVPLLELLDRRGWTRREGTNTRRSVPVEPAG